MDNTMAKSILFNSILCASIITTSTTFGMEELSNNGNNPLPLKIYLLSNKDTQYYLLNDNGSILLNSPIHVDKKFQTMNSENKSTTTLKTQYNASLSIKDNKCSLVIKNRNNDNSPYKVNPIISSTITPSQINYLSQQASTTTRDNNQQTLAFALDENNNVYHIDGTILEINTQQPIASLKQVQNFTITHQALSMAKSQEETNKENNTEQKNNPIICLPEQKNDISYAKIYIQDASTKKLHYIRNNGTLLERPKIKFDDDNC